MMKKLGRIDDFGLIASILLRIALHRGQQFVYICWSVESMGESLPGCNYDAFVLVEELMTKATFVYGHHVHPARVGRWSELLRRQRSH